jgi:hypothetical protein
MWWQIQKWIRDEADIPPGRDRHSLALLLFVISTYADGEKWQTFVGRHTLAQAVWANERTVRRQLEKLADLRLIGVEKRPGKTSLITLDPDRTTYLHPGHPDVHTTVDTQMSTHPGHLDVHRSTNNVQVTPTTAGAVLRSKTASRGIGQAMRLSDMPRRPLPTGDEWVAAKETCPDCGNVMYPGTKRHTECMLGEYVGE